jgi:hypothetical protein
MPHDKTHALFIVLDTYGHFLYCPAMFSRPTDMGGCRRQERGEEKERERERERGKGKGRHHQ